MAPSTLYPRSTVKRIIKAHSNRPLSKNVDVLVSIPNIAILTFARISLTSQQIFLNYVLFMQEYVIPVLP
jgi:hypothetical protein